METNNITDRGGGGLNKDTKIEKRDKSINIKQH